MCRWAGECLGPWPALSIVLQGNWPQLRWQQERLVTVSRRLRVCPARDRHWLVCCGWEGVTVKMIVMKLAPC